MHEAIRVAMLDVRAAAAGLSMYISAGSALPGPYDHPDSAHVVFDTVDAMGIEALCMVTTHMFRMRLEVLGGGADQGAAADLATLGAM
ncbi:hypothetical protein [Nocardia terpenica]|uniref:Uncharacterized protein n=1 Tax=Nocardia terpenica TaxID=455432 RepID=A0A164LKA1_9NOCA|nr:hypothetical protein [Nocardia terpenica]KZM72500.1 hypothetical protein AWN90_27200 [Nocardia terpenica]NQE92631.1 hypothetical protein [Nocardia terpenica]